MKNKREARRARGKVWRWNAKRATGNSLPQIQPR